MAKSLDYFFNNRNHITSVSEEEYNYTSFIINALNTIIDTSDTGFYIIDYYRHNLLYISENITRWSGISVDSISRYGIDFLPDDEFDMLVEINNAVFDFLNKIPSKEYCNYKVSYNFNYSNNNKRYLINHTFAPLEIRNGKIWLSLCTITLSSRASHGNIIMHKKGSNIQFKYSLGNLHWTSEETIKLTEIEKLIIRYSAQGQTNEEIAQMLCKSIDSIKSHKKKMYQKMRVHNMPSAIVYAQNQCLL